MLARGWFVAVVMSNVPEISRVEDGVVLLFFFFVDQPDWVTIMVTWLVD